MISRLRTIVVRMLPRGRFGRNVGILAGGTVFAQGLIVLSLPILTRLFVPEDFTLLAVYIALLGILTVVSCLRLNIAIPLPERDSDAMSLVALALTSALAISSCLAVMVFLFPQRVATALGQPLMVPFLWLIPVGVILGSSYSALEYWAARKQRFGAITRTRMTRAVTGSTTQLGYGVVSPTPFGLLLGHMVYSGFGTLGLARVMWREDRALISTIRLADLRQNLIRYKRFPLASVPEALFNTGGIHIPVLIIAAVAAAPEAGYLMLAMRVMGLPMGLVGGSVAQVYLAEAGGRLRDGSLVSFTKSSMWALFKVGGLTLVLVGAISPFAFPYVFGDEWARAGTIVAWMTPWFVLQFVASPISAVLHVTGNTVKAMGLQAFGLILRLGSVMIAVSFASDWAVETYALSGAIFYAVYLLMVFAVLQSQSRAAYPSE